MSETGDTLMPKRIGIILVHGIREQRRFDPLDWQGGRQSLSAAVVMFGGALIGTLAVGLVSSWGLFKRDQDPETPSTQGGPLPDPGLPAWQPQAWPVRGDRA